MSFCVAISGPGVPLRPAADKIGDRLEQPGDGGHLGDGGDIGGKARSLVLLANGGWPVPPAFAVTTALFRALRLGGPPLPARLRDAADLDALERAREVMLTAPLPAGFRDELRKHCTRLSAGTAAVGGRFSVRSSFASEDRLGALAAGLFLSETSLPEAGVEPALRAVLGSALSPAAFRYASDRHLDVDRAGMAALIHPFIAGSASGSAAFDPAGSTPPIIEVTRPSPDAPLAAAARTALEQALRALARQHGAIEIEWVAEDAAVTLLQMRGYQPHHQRPWPAAAALGPGRWRWDATHNPLPLSQAHADLIHFVDQRCRIGIRQKVVGGYLFFAHADDHPTPGSRGHETTRAAPTTTPPPLREQLTSIEGALSQRLAALGPDPSLEEALALFAAMYERLFGTLAPAARRARAALDDLLRRRAFDGAGWTSRLLSQVPSVADERWVAAARIRAAGSAAERTAAVRDYLARFGDEAPVWDVAAPTYRDAARALENLKTFGPPPNSPPSPSDGELAWQRSARALAAQLSPAEQQSWPALLREARDAVAVGEEDDHLYARLQAVVRRALLREGERLRDAGVLATRDDVFQLPLERVRADVAGTAPLTKDEALSLIQRARAADQAAREAPPPLPRDGGRRPALHEESLVRGIGGSAGRAIGRAHLYPAPDGALPEATDIVIATTLLPTELPLIEAAGFVVETGGALGHVAAQARERGIPAVVGAVGASQRISPGAQLLIDGDSGLVVLL